MEKWELEKLRILLEKLFSICTDINETQVVYSALVLVNKILKDLKEKEKKHNG